ncbi:MAG: hypothetical protein NVSMB13_17020 [Mycobacteriales bacterium]
MSTGLPDGFVDPLDVAAVTDLLRTATGRLGMAGVVDLLGQVPGVRISPGRAGGLLRKAEPARLHAGEDVLVLAEPAVVEHIVGGIVLSHRPVSPVELPGLLAGIVRDAVTFTGATADASVALTAARDALGLTP